MTSSASPENGLALYISTLGRLKTTPPA